MNNLKHIYSEIIKGCSCSRNGLFIKHFGVKDESTLQAFYNKCYLKAISQGLQTEEQCLKDLARLGIWDKEGLIKEKKAKLSDTRSALKLVKNFQDIIFIEKQMEQMAKDIDELEMERSNHLKSTAENHANAKMGEYAIEYAFFKDKDLTERAFPDGEGLIDQDQFEELVVEYNTTLQEINVDNLKKIAFSNILLNHIYLADSVLVFYGKPVVDLSYFQIDLYGYGMQYKNIISSHGYPPEDVKDSPTSILEWAESLSNKTQDNPQQPKVTPDLAKALKEKGTVNFSDFVNANSGGKRIIV